MDRVYEAIGKTDGIAEEISTDADLIYNAMTTKKINRDAVKTIARRIGDQTEQLTLATEIFPTDDYEYDPVDHWPWPPYGMSLTEEARWREVFA